MLNLHTYWYLTSINRLSCYPFLRSKYLLFIHALYNNCFGSPCVGPTAVGTLHNTHTLGVVYLLQTKYLFAMITVWIADFFDCTTLGPDWTYWNHSCYLLDPEQTTTWIDAHQWCSHQHPFSYLAVVNSEEENTYLRGLLPADTRATLWLGCRDFEGTGNWSCSDNSLSNKHYYVESPEEEFGFWSKFLQSFIFVLRVPCTDFQW